ncbi:MAG: hypothetical protein PHC88_16685 [Terrimicrobiaceae bacterium]|nr:hypothetical protein [Terrimicrobiaceae bacterium]
MENASDAAISYNPQDLAVRLDERIYTQSLADQHGSIQACRRRGGC